MLRKFNYLLIVHAQVLGEERERERELKVSILESLFRDSSAWLARFNSARSLRRPHDLFPRIDHAATKDLSLTISVYRFLWEDPLVTLQTRIWTIANGKKEFYWQESRYITFRGNSRLLERVSYNAKRWRSVIYGFYRWIFRLAVRIHIYIEPYAFSSYINCTPMWRIIEICAQYDPL